MAPVAAHQLTQRANGVDRVYLSDKELIANEEMKKLQTEVDANANAVVNEVTHTFAWNEVIWSNVFIIGGLHVAALYSMYLFAIGEIKWQNIFVSSLFGFFSAIGVTIGAHRLWAHRAFKAKWPLRFAFLNCVCFHCVCKLSSLQTHSRLLQHLRSGDGHLRLVP